MQFSRFLAIGLVSVGTISATVSAADSVQSKDPPATTDGGKETKITDQGTVIGTVKSKGAKFVEVTSESGKTAKYVPEWKAGGPDREIVKIIGTLKVGDKVSMDWIANDHLRVKAIKVLTEAPKSETPKTEPAK